jgi:hypothetical protein
LLAPWAGLTTLGGVLTIALLAGLLLLHGAGRCVSCFACGLAWGPVLEARRPRCSRNWLIAPLPAVVTCCWIGCCSLTGWTQLAMRPHVIPTPSFGFDWLSRWRRAPVRWPPPAGLRALSCKLSGSPACLTWPAERCCSPGSGAWAPLLARPDGRGAAAGGCERCLS